MGSKKEKVLWHNSSSHLDNYIFDENGNKKIEHVVYMDGNMTQNLDNLFKNYGLDIDVKPFLREPPLV